jgi:integrase
VTADDLRAFRLWLEQHPGVHGRAHLATATIAWLLGDARNLFYWAVDSGLIDKNPVPRRLLPRIQERPPDHLSDEEIAAVLAIPEPHAFIIRLALGTGMRWSELCRACRSPPAGESPQLTIRADSAPYGPDRKSDHKKPDH